MNPAHPRETTPYAQARALVTRWSKIDMRLAAPADLRDSEETLLALHAAAPLGTSLPGGSLLQLLRYEHRRRAVARQHHAPVVAGPYTARLLALDAPKYFTYA